jgi:lysine-N-methylase
LYPFIFVPVGNQVRVDLRFDCPAAAANRGRALPQHRAALLGLLPLVVPERANELPVPPLFDSVQLSWAQLCRITETYDRLLLEESLNLTQRIICAVQLTALLRTEKIAEVEGRELNDFLEVVAIRVVAAIADAPMPRVRPPWLVRSAFRQVLGIYGREDRRGERGQLLSRLSAALRLLAGHGLVPRLRPDTPAVPFAAMEEAVGVPEGEVADVIIRYYRLRLASMGFFGLPFYQRDYLEGLGALLLTYPLLLWFARLEACGRGLAAPDVAAAIRAVQIVDHQHGRSPALDLPSERNRQRFLTERSHLRSLVVWYGS